jgi:protein SCO1/2
MPAPNKKVLASIAVVLIVVVVGGYFFYASRPAQHSEAPAEACSVQKDTCSNVLPGGGKVSLAITPRPIAYAAPLNVDVAVEGLVADAVELDFAGITTDTSYNRVTLKAAENGHYKGIANLPVCVSSGMTWQATVLVESGGKRLSIPFLFNSDPAVAPKGTPRQEVAAKPLGGDFILRSTEGPLSLRKFRGKALVMFFGQTAPPATCPNPLGVIDKAFAMLTPAELALVQGLMVSTDLERDTPEQLKAFLGAQHPNFIGASGAGADLAGAARLFGANFTRLPAGADGTYRIDHSAIIYLIAPNGAFVEQLTSQDPGQLAAKLREVLARK